MIGETDDLFTPRPGRKLVRTSWSASDSDSASARNYRGWIARPEGGGMREVVWVGTYRGKKISAPTWPLLKILIDQHMHAQERDEIR